MATCGTQDGDGVQKFAFASSLGLRLHHKKAPPALRKGLSQESAPAVGLEPTTSRLTADCSTN